MAKELATLSSTEKWDVSHSPFVFEGNYSLCGADQGDLIGLLNEMGVPAQQQRMRLAQLWNHIYAFGRQDFDSLTTMSKDMRGLLGSMCNLNRPEIVSDQISQDGTRKWLLRFAPKGEKGQRHEAEMVYIPEADRGTLCISSQVGCTLNCRFCHTGTQVMVRNLSHAEIVSQVMVAKDLLGDWPHADIPEGAIRPKGEKAITNIVFMGMGEPLYNFENVKRAVEVMCSSAGLAFSKRRVTLSTAGVVPEIERCGREMGVMLAVSLHAPVDELRDEIVPINRKYPIQQLLNACRAYPGLCNAKRITFEYVMLKDVNDKPEHARKLVELLKGIPAKVNLIPFNPWPGASYRCSDWSTIEIFGEIVNNAGYASPIRRPRGRDILAACGQLKSASKRLRKSILEREALSHSDNVARQDLNEAEEMLESPVPVMGTL